MTVYYVDANLGSDVANGTSLATAWRTLSKVVAKLFDDTIIGGDHVRYKGRFMDQILDLVKSTSAGAGAEIIHENVDDNDPAVFDGGWIGTNTFGRVLKTSGAASFYHKLIGIRFDDHRHKTPTQSTTAGTSGAWLMNDSHHITLERVVSDHMAIFIDSDDVTLTEVTVRDIFAVWGTFYNPDGSSELQPITTGDAIYFHNGAQRGKAEYCTVINAGHCGIQWGSGNPANPGATGTMRHCLVINPYATPCYLAAGYDGVTAEFNTFIGGGDQTIGAWQLWSDLNNLGGNPGDMRIQPRPGMSIRGTGHTARYNRMIGNSGGGVHFDAFVGENDFVLPCVNCMFERNSVWLYNNGIAGQGAIRIAKDYSIAAQGRGALQPAMNNLTIRRNFIGGGNRYNWLNGQPKALVYITSSGAATSINPTTDVIRIENNRFHAYDGAAGDAMMVVRNTDGTYAVRTIANYEAAYATVSSGNGWVVPSIADPYGMDLAYAAGDMSIGIGNNIGAIPHRPLLRRY